MITIDPDQVLQKLQGGERMLRPAGGGGRAATRRWHQLPEDADNTPETPHISKAAASGPGPQPASAPPSSQNEKQ